MAEKLSPFGQEWIMYGQDPGSKTQGLLDLQGKLSGRKNLGMALSLMVLPGISLGASIYRDVAKEMVGLYGSSPNWLDYPLEGSFETITRKIFDLLPVGRPIAIRSSGMVEEASGKYRTNFYMRRDINPLPDLWVFRDSIAEIYSDYYYKDLRQQSQYRTKNIDTEGMGILIQPVVGSISERDKTLFAPAISGVFTVVNGEPYWNVVVGLGTRAVGMGEKVIEKGNKLLEGNFSFVAKLEKLELMDALVAPTFREVVQTLTCFGLEPDRFYPAEFIKLRLVAKAWLSEYRVDKPYYWEFAIDPSYEKVCILQSTTLSPVVISGYELSPAQGRVVYEVSKKGGDQNFETDAVHIGKKKGRGIVFVNVSEGFNRQDLDVLDLIGNEHPGFLLLVPPDIFEPRYKLELPVLKKVGGIIELRSKSAQLPKSENERFFGGEAGGHLVAGSEYRHLIFQAVTLKTDPDVVIEDLLGEPQKIYGRDVYFWERGFIIENAQTAIRLELLD